MTHRCGVNEECKKYREHMIIQRIGALENWGWIITISEW